MTGQVHGLRLVAAAFALALCTASSALAYDGRSPDTIAAAGQTHIRAVLDARSPDTRHATRQPNGQTSLDVRSPDAVDSTSRPVLDSRAATAAYVDRSSPDTGYAAARVVTSGVLTANGGGFVWADAAIGAGVTLALMLLLLAGKQFMPARRSTSAARAQASS